MLQNPDYSIFIFLSLESIKEIPYIISLYVCHRKEPEVIVFMKLGIIGLPLAGKTTVFEILTRQTESTIPKTEYRIGTVTVPNAQIDTLSQIYNPKKTTYAQVEYLLPGMNISQDAQIKEQHVWTHIRTCDSLIHVVCNFQAQDPDASDPVDHIRQLDHEMIFADLIIVEKRLERMTEDKKRNKPVDEEEQAMLLQCQTLLEEDTPIRKDPELTSAPKLRGYTLLSAKPMLILFNNKDGNDALPPLPDTLHADTMVVQGKL